MYSGTCYSVVVSHLLSMQVKCSVEKQDSTTAAFLETASWPQGVTVTEPAMTGMTVALMSPTYVQVSTCDCTACVAVEISFGLVMIATMNARVEN